MWFYIPLRAKLKPLSTGGWSTETEQKEVSFLVFFPTCAVITIYTRYNAHEISAKAFT